MFQEAVHVHICDKWVDYAAFTAFPACCSYAPSCAAFRRHHAAQPVPTYAGGARQGLASVASLSHAAFPVSQPGRPRFHFRKPTWASLMLQSSDCSTAQGSLVARLQSSPLPAKPLASYQIKPTTIWVEPPSTDDPRCRGALRNPGQTSESTLDIPHRNSPRSRAPDLQEIFREKRRRRSYNEAI